MAMLLLLSSVAPCVLFLILVASSSNVQGQSTSCLTSVDRNTDYFGLNKVASITSHFWEVEYHRTYKILSDKSSGSSYVLYLCGSTPPDPATEQPLMNRTDIMDTIQIPVTSVAISQTNTITYLEQLGALDFVKIFLSSPDLVSSPCFLDMIHQGAVTVLDTNDTLLAFTNDDTNIAKLNDTVVFQSPYEYFPFVHTVNVSEYVEPTNQAIFEWIKYYSTFFNLESVANQATDAAQDRYQCVAFNSNRVVTDRMSQKPKVLWAYYSTYCSGWDIAKCDQSETGNYYCQYARDCSADILSSFNGSITACGGLKFMSSEELVAFGKDADVWIFPAPYWNDTYAQNKELLDNMKSVQNKKVYDYQGSGENAWFEQRYAEYYDVLQDFGSVVGTTQALTNHHGWFRNVFNEPVGSYAPCGEQNRTILPYTFDCGDLGPVSEPANFSSSSSSSAFTRKEWQMISFVSALTFCLFL